MHIFLVILMLMLPVSVFGQTIYFQADAETGDLSQWTHCGEKPKCGGGVYYESAVSASQEVVHSGAWAYKHDLPDPAAQNNAKFIRQSFFYGPDGYKQGVQEGYYSAWYNIGEGSHDSRWWNIMQWKVSDPGGSHPVVFEIDEHEFGEGVRELVLIHNACIYKFVPCIDPPPNVVQYSRGRYRQQNPIPLTDDTWFHLEAYYKASATNGEIRIWQDGVEIFHLSDPELNTLQSGITGIHEEITNRTWVYWGIGNYVAASAGGRHLMYTDDAMVTDYRAYQGSNPQTVPKPPTALRIEEKP